MQNKLKSGTTAYKNEFNKANYKRISAYFKPQELNNIEVYCKANNMSKSSFVTRACEYVINNNIKLD